MYVIYCVQLYNIYVFQMAVGIILTKTQARGLWEQDCVWGKPFHLRGVNGN